MDTSEYDVIIVGGGPAGLTAGLYTCRSRLKVVLIEKMVIGGQVYTTDIVENYPGFEDGINGPELIQNMEEQAKRFGLQDGYVHHLVQVLLLSSSLLRFCCKLLRFCLRFEI